MTSLQDRFLGIFRRLRGEGKIQRRHLDEALQEIRRSLLEADVHFRVVKTFLARIEERAVGEKVLESLTPAQQILAIVRDELTVVLGGQDAPELKLSRFPAVVLFCGLQGAGKTTTVGKLGLRLRERGRYPLFVAADLKRAAAVEQLVQLGEKVGLPVVAPQLGESAIQLAERSLRVARERGRDVVLVDTAGRLHVDEELMEELVELTRTLDPQEVLYVADAMTGQDALRSARAFAEKLPLSGVILTKLDGDTRGGAALSVREVTGVPIRYVGVGERPEQLELFSPSRMAARILGLGDLLSLIERAEQAATAREAEKLAEDLSRGDFTLDHLRDQLRQLRKMGPLETLVEALPRLGPFNRIPKIGGAEEQRLRRFLAILDSMTREERRRPQLLNASRKRRIAKGSGTTVQEVNQLLRHHLELQRQFRQLQGTWLRRTRRK
jgi:signal recognition particle subunit SRP54